MILACIFKLNFKSESAKRGAINSAGNVNIQVLSYFSATVLVCHGKIPWIIRYGKFCVCNGIIVVFIFNNNPDTHI